MARACSVHRLVPYALSWGFKACFVGDTTAFCGRGASRACSMGWNGEPAFGWARISRVFDGALVKEARVLELHAALPPPVHPGGGSVFEGQDEPHAMHRRFKERLPRYPNLKHVAFLFRPDMESTLTLRRRSKTNGRG